MSVESRSRFQLTTAVRGSLPLTVGLCGPSGSGKTYSALRLATGIQRVSGGEIAVIDTEANRALHYAESFKFQHMPFSPPFSPLDYIEALKVCVDSGAKTVVIDSMSHEHEGPGGVLEWHAAEVARLSRSWKTSESAVQFPAWAEPKAARRQLLNYILQQNVNLVCCFRAKRKVAMPTKAQKAAGQRDPVDLGWMPVAGQEYAYELCALGVLPPGAKGVPDWDCVDPGTEMVVKRPAQFEAILAPGKQLDESMGEAMARWAQGSSEPESMSELFEELLAGVASSNTLQDLDNAAVSIKAARVNKTETETLRKAYKAKLKDLETRASEQAATREPGEEG